MRYATGRFRILLTPNEKRGYLRTNCGWPESPTYGVLQQETRDSHTEEAKWIDVPLETKE